MSFFIRSIFMFSLLIIFNNTQLSAQTQWYPAVLVNKRYVRDTTKFRYPVTCIIEEKGKTLFYGRGTRYPSEMRYDKIKKAYFSKNGITMITMPENKGYYTATYIFKIIDLNTSKLTVKKKGEKEEITTYIKSLLPVVYPSGN